MARVSNKYKFKEAWQAMMKKGGSPPEAKKLAAAFQEDVVSVMLERTEIDEENKVIRAKSLEGTKEKKRTNKPSNFVTNDDFCPGCALQLKSMTEERTNFWTEVFQRELADSDDPNAMMEGGFRNMKPGVLTFRGWGLESRIGAEAKAQMDAVRKDIEEARKKIEPYYPYLHGVREADRISNIPLNLRGDPFNLGPEVPRGFLSILSKAEPEPFAKGSGRLELAERIVEQPLATRVYVNRIWKAHFGTGIVDTPSNFGTTGERPTNPELLEYLAATFAKNGQSTKKLHREILLSNVYQLSSDSDAANLAKDSGNRSYWRYDKKRMDAEQLRDSVLQVSGLLDKGIGGPSADLKPSFPRRTIYGKVSRYKLDEYLQLFDFPSPSISAEKRFTTTVPLQRLFLLNSDFMQIQAEELAKRVAPEPDNRARIRKLYQLAYARDPLEKEIQLGLEYLKSEPDLSYEERKKKAAEKEKEGERDRRGRPGPMGKPGEAAPPGGLLTKTEMPKEMPAEVAAETAPAEGGAGADAAPAGLPMGMGMMAGMPGIGRRPGAPAAEEVKYEPTVWGRYAKVLLSSSEFLFIN